MRMVRWLRSQEVSPRLRGRVHEFKWQRRCDDITSTKLCNRQWVAVVVRPYAKGSNVTRLAVSNTELKCRQRRRAQSCRLSPNKLPVPFFAFVLANAPTECRRLLITTLFLHIVQLLPL